MRVALAFLILLSTGGYAAASEATFARSAEPVHFKRGYQPRDVRVHDGDTACVVLPGKEFISNTTKCRSLRLYGIDAPELNIACEKDRAVQARDLLATLTSAPHKIIVREVTNRRDKYARTLAVVLSDGRDASEIMVARGLAQPYLGGKRPAWEGCP